MAGRGQSRRCPCEPTPLSFAVRLEMTSQNVCLFRCTQDKSIVFLLSREVVQTQQRKKEGQEGLFCVLGLVPLSAVSVIHTAGQTLSCREVLAVDLLFASLSAPCLWFLLPVGQLWSL